MEDGIQLSNIYYYFYKLCCNIKQFLFQGVDESHKIEIKENCGDFTPRSHNEQYNEAYIKNYT